ncbi:MAG: phosphate acetyl/butyryl transferase [Alkalibacterium sp.]|uniref:Phosphate butyryltransferase n=1 Tax=Alkalibacterium gilvum TaxID=1130080 RepID=A0A1H6TEK3_9LACT|nr:phosphate acyltransferase [Alkalibacterium gilvum]MDN6385464.1 phosphate acetyl/butyryl transferase [Alkalibacterium sp.]MDN6398488.1 phosphate acetyl/butyryl transferase [Alkalibacterium sp.]MDN6734352.1 phosphate acetyl/butyryl transferase [Tetragenococcus koreensis]SEI74665.1 phosphate butyryltransferase [Alkalibacterium gilvum]
MGLVTNLQSIRQSVDSKKLKIAVVKAANEDVLKSIKRGIEEDIIEPVLIDDEGKLTGLLKQLSIDLEKVEIIDQADDKKAAEKGVELARDKKVDALMKGFIGTGDILRPVVNKETGIRSSTLLSHVAVIFVPKLNRFVAITDGGMVVEPNKEQLKTIIEHGVEVMKSIDVKESKAAILSASENVMSKNNASVWASELTEEMRSDDYVVEGPISLDLSLIPDIVEEKNYRGKIQGDADIIVTPDIVSGNSLSKSLTLFGGAEMAGLIIGATVPIILTSRASSSDEKYASILLAQHVMNQKENG